MIHYMCYHASDPPIASDSGDSELALCRIAWVLLMACAGKVQGKSRRGMVWGSYTSCISYQMRVQPPPRSSSLPPPNCGGVCTGLQKHPRVHTSTCATPPSLALITPLPLVYTNNLSLYKCCTACLNSPRWPNMRPAQPIVQHGAHTQLQGRRNSPEPGRRQVQWPAWQVSPAQ